jgi:asparagine synthase (glutamine-hydrolysing)
MMQGIAGTYGVREEDTVKRMLTRLPHRGGGRARIVTDGKLTLGARARSGGPRALTEDERLAVASDSYIFNKARLAEKHLNEEAAALPDNEFLLALYRKLGTRMFRELDGAYVVAISDGGRLILARDRYGLKPLYISGSSRKGSFSSEMKSQMLDEGDFVPFPPGKMFIGNKGYSTIPAPRAGTGSARKGGSKTEKLRELLIESVRACQEGPGSFNILLSGGLDSSVVTAAAARVTDIIHTACVGTDDSEDIRMARKVSERLGTDHKERIYDVDEMLEVLDEVTYYAESYDYPLIRSCIPNFMATHLFDDRSLATLCGEGGDEVFAGYDYMRDIRGDAGITKERMHLLRTGYLTGFQRVDRMTSSASLDGRMPIMSGAVVRFGLGLPRREIIGRRPFENKLALRKAFSKDLPKEVVWRKKRRFSDGAGSIHSLAGIADDIVTDAEFKKERAALPKGAIRTKEELLYYRSFAKHFDRACAREAIGFTPRP